MLHMTATTSELPPDWITEVDQSRGQAGRLVSHRAAEWARLAVNQERFGPEHKVAHLS